MEEKETKEQLSWTSHPLVDQPQQTLLLLIVMIVVSLILYNTAVVEWKTPIYFYLGMAFFIGSMMSWFIPTTYKLDNNKIEIYYWKIRIEKQWTDYKCWYADKRGVLLGTFTRPRRLDNFRGQSLRFSKDKSEKEELFKLLEQKIGNRY